jgi:ABC-type nickel/cobalt efflux system permease component RcnA
LAALAFGLRLALPLEAISEWGERIVGATLIALGVWGFRRLLGRRLHAHAHRHGDEEHVHFHVHASGEDHDAPGAHVHRHTAFGVGVLHGAAGASHLLGVIPGFALPGGEAAAYLAGFAAGTVGAMTLFAAALGWAAPARTERGLRLYRWALGAASAACAGVGVAWLALSWRGGGP